MNAPTTLLIARHGEAHYNRDQTIGGPRCDRGLTDRGRAQVQELANGLRDQYSNFHALYASPLRRAAESAAIAETMGLRVNVDDDLRERDHGDADGRTWMDAVAAFDAIPAFEPDRPLAPGGETWRAYLQRAATALTRIIDGRPGQRILVVGHGQTADAAFHLFLRLSPTSRAHAALALHNTGVSVWEQQPVAWTRPDAGWRWTLVAHNVLVSGSPLS